MAVLCTRLNCSLALSVSMKQVCSTEHSCAVDGARDSLAQNECDEKKLDDRLMTSVDAMDAIRLMILEN